MRSNVERFRGSNKAVQTRKRHLQIQRAFAAHDSSIAKFCFFLWHRFGDDYFAARREAESFSYKLICTRRSSSVISFILSWSGDILLRASRNAPTRCSNSWRLPCTRYPGGMLVSKELAKTITETPDRS